MWAIFVSNSLSRFRRCTLNIVLRPYGKLRQVVRFEFSDFMSPQRTSRSRLRRLTKERFARRDAVGAGSTQLLYLFSRSRCSWFWPWWWWLSRWWFLGLSISEWSWIWWWWWWWKTGRLCARNWQFDISCATFFRTCRFRDSDVDDMMTWCWQ